jgi:hypothetical protein
VTPRKSRPTAEEWPNEKWPSWSVINSAGSRVFSLAPCDSSPFPASTGARWRTLHRQSRAIRTAFQNLGSVDICVSRSSATCAAELGLRESASSVDVPTAVTRLGAVRGWHLDQSATGPRQLVSQAPDETTPPGIKDTPGHAPTRAHHVINLKLLNNDRAVALGVGGAEIVDDELALPSHLAMNVGDASLGLLPVGRSFLLARDVALCPGKSGHCRGVESRGFDHVPVAVCDDVDHAPVECHYGLGSRRWVRHLNLASDAREPLVPVAPNGARLRLPLERPMLHHANAAKLGKAQARVVDLPSAGVGFADCRRLATLAFPARRPGNSLETTLPSTVKLDEQLTACVSRHVSEPRQLGPKSGELLVLVGGGWEPSTGSREPHQPLFVGQVPEEPQRRFPSSKPLDLLWRGIDAVSKPFTNQHHRNHSTFNGARPAPAQEGGTR